MKIEALTPDSYFESLPEEKKAPMLKLRNHIKEHLPQGFEETISYGMVGYVVPLSVYPNGYHCKKDEPLPFLSIAQQKNFIGFYHMGIYAMPDILDWFKQEYPNHVNTKLNMGKSCIRFKKPDQIPYALLAELLSKVTVQDWIATYENKLLR